MEEKKITAKTVVGIVIFVALIAVLAFFALRAVRRGKGGCGCGCASCPHANTCHRHKEE